MADQGHSGGGSWLQSRNSLVLIVFLGVAAFYLVTEHSAHLLDWLPFAIFLLCPLMHLFMHGGHGGHDGHHNAKGSPEHE
jgi:hypothetical protein